LKFLLTFFFKVLYSYLLKETSGRKNRLKYSTELIIITVIRRYTKTNRRYFRRAEYNVKPAEPAGRNTTANRYSLPGDIQKQTGTDKPGDIQQKTDGELHRAEYKDNRESG
jgi:hypothetical protein